MHIGSSKVIVVEGLISSGKSTLVAELGQALGPKTLVLQEPDEQNNANPYLADFYADPQRWAMTMQIHLLGLRLRMHLHAQWHALQGYGLALIDRSFYGDTCFARLQLAMDTLSAREFDTYQAIYKAMTTMVLLPTVCIRILSSPVVCRERIISRMEKQTGRACESAVSLEYLQALDREIDFMVDVLRRQGVAILDVPWSANRDTPEIREQTVQDLATRIHAVSPPDPFLDIHRRSL